ncbi:hypothetical protein GJB62_35910 (plasmid) [Nostoc sp. ATCC 53789]|nr:WD40 repeat domain-containing protein [Nostoc sp. ATCC 53789]QHG21237.1 hypothetical protein GJB62_35910 [Nostoc sp. ATCC 53789]
MTVVGPSGSGKSSVVFAGLIPQLRAEGNWLIESFRPGNQPFDELALALVRQLEPELGKTEQVIKAAQLARSVKQSEVTLQQVVFQIFRFTSNKHLLLVVDQFEELYSLCQDKGEQERFVDTLLNIIHHKHVTLVFTLRADFYSYALSHRQFRDTLQQFTPQLLSSMNREELQAAIEQPAEKLEVQLEAQLTQRILDDVGKEPGNLPLLEFALTRLWSLQQNRVLTHQAYNEIGGVKRALVNHAEQIYQQLNKAQQKQTQRIFLQLVRPGEGTEDTRCVATRAEVGNDNWEIVSYLAGYQARLVVTGHDKKSGEDTVEIVHETLIREWITLREWINANRQFRIWQERLRITILEWKNSNYDSGALLRGVPLAVAEDWLKQRGLEISVPQQKFIEESLMLRDKERQERERQRRRVIVGLTCGLMLAFGLAGVAMWQRQEAQLKGLNDQLIAGSLSAEKLLTSNNDLEALVVAVKAGKILQSSKGISADTKIQTIATLSRVVYGVKEYNRLQDDSNRFIAVDFSPDGNTIASGNSDGTIKLWSKEGRELQTFKSHNDIVNSVSFSPDGNIIASGYSDGTIKLWSKEGRELQTFKSHNDRVNRVSFSPDGNIIASGYSDGTIKLWSKEGRELRTITLKGHSIFGSVIRISFSPDGNIIASGDSDGKIILWSKDGKELRTIKVTSDSFTPDSNTITSNGSIYMAIKPSKKQVAGGLYFPVVHQRDVSIISFSPDGNTIASGEVSGVIRLWNKDGKQLQTIKGHSNRVTSISFSPDGNTIASAALDGTIKLWYLENRVLRKTLESQSSSSVQSISLSPNGNIIASSQFNGIILWSKDGRELRTLENSNSSSSNISFSPDGNIIASGDMDGKIILWSKDGKELRTLKAHSKFVTSMSFSPDGNIIASGNDDGKIILWSKDGKELRTIKGHSSLVRSVSFSPDGNIIASGDMDGKIILWSKDGKKLRIIKGHSSVQSISFSPDGNIIAFGDDETIKLWSLRSKEPQVIRGHNSRITSISFSPDGNTFASASNDGIIKLWSKDGRELQTLNAPINQRADSRVKVSFSPNGKTLISASSEGEVILWNFDLEDLLNKSCDWLHDYLKNNPNVSKSDRRLCDSIK